MARADLALSRWRWSVSRCSRRQVARAGEPSFGKNDLETLFFISKSDDKNRVDYGMRLDKNGAPFGEEPVFPYWFGRGRRALDQAEASRSDHLPRGTLAGATEPTYACSHD